MNPQIFNEKYESTGETFGVFGIRLWRIRARKSFGAVVAGDVGGFISGEENLSVSGDARVYGNAG